jgi:uncharacterized repeat protein (TIGR03803 family)
MFTRLNPSRMLPFLGLAACTVAVLASAGIAHAQPGYAIVYNFCQTPGCETDGSQPVAGLIQASDGTLYGTTRFGGASHRGAIFQVAPDGSGFALLHSFTGGADDGERPVAGLIQDPDGTLYGTSELGGSSSAGTVFRMAPDGSGFAVLHSFTGGAEDGQFPVASLIQGPDGTLYGTTQIGGVGPCAVGGGCGTVFQIAPDGSGYAVLHFFTGSTTDGSQPLAGLIQGPDGTLYGTTVVGGIRDAGTIFQMAPDGSGFALLHSFTIGEADGDQPAGGLIQGPDGALYGTTAAGGSSNTGTVFQIAPDGSGYGVLLSFTGFPGPVYPQAGLVQGPDGTLYGTSANGGSSASGTIFQLAPDGSGLAVLHSFIVDGMDGRSPFAGLIQGPDGTLYGTTFGGGAYGNGAVFQLAPSASAATRR